MAAWPSRLLRQPRFHSQTPWPMVKQLSRAIVRLQRQKVTAVCLCLIQALRWMSCFTSRCAISSYRSIYLTKGYWALPIWWCSNSPQKPVISRQHRYYATMAVWKCSMMLKRLTCQCRVQSRQRLNPQLLTMVSPLQLLDQHLSPIEPWMQTHQWTLIRLIVYWQLILLSQAGANSHFLSSTLWLAAKFCRRRPLGKLRR